MLGNVGGLAWHHTVAHCSLAPALHLQCHNQGSRDSVLLILWTDCSLVTTINTLSLCCAFAGSLFAECACTRAILTDEVFCHRQLGGECAQSWTRVKAPELGAPRLCARCVRVITTHCTVTTADGLRLGTLDTELPQGGNNRAWPFLGAVFYRKYCVETCQTIWRTWPGLALSSGGAVGSYS